jgi:hypothetical protein
MVSEKLGYALATTIGAEVLLAGSSGNPINAIRLHTSTRRFQE